LIFASTSVYILCHALSRLMFLLLH